MAQALTLIRPNHAFWESGGQLGSIAAVQCLEATAGPSTALIAWAINSAQDDNVWGGVGVGFGDGVSGGQHGSIAAGQCLEATAGPSTALIASAINSARMTTCGGGESVLDLRMWVSRGLLVNHYVNYVVNSRSEFLGNARFLGKAPQGLKPIDSAAFTARLKPCPFMTGSFSQAMKPPPILRRLCRGGIPGLPLERLFSAGCPGWNRGNSFNPNNRRGTPGGGHAVQGAGRG
jgi:hypothetical protein